jgi:hypothetical protein
MALVFLSHYLNYTALNFSFIMPAFINDPQMLIIISSISQILDNLILHEGGQFFQFLNILLINFQSLESLNNKLNFPSQVAM